MLGIMSGDYKKKWLSIVILMEYAQVGIHGKGGKKVERYIH